MMGDVDVHGEKNFAAGKAAVGRVVHSAELRVREIRDDRGTIIEGIADKLYDGVLLRGRWQGGRIGILEAGTELVVGGGDVGHQLAEVHGFGVGTASDPKWHYLGLLDSQEFVSVASWKSNCCYGLAKALLRSGIKSVSPFLVASASGVMPCLSLTWGFAPCRSRSFRIATRS